MTYQQRDNSGTLFRNDKREKDTRPNATGKAMIGGRLYYVSAWTKDGAKGKFQSLAFKLVESDAAEARPKAAGPSSGHTHPAYSLDDEIPFAPEVR